MDFSDLNVWRDVQEEVPSYIQYLIDKQRANFPSEILNQPSNIFWKNRAGFYLGSNTQTAKLFGYSHGREIVGLTTDQLVPAHLSARVIFFDELVLASGNAFTLEEYGKDKSDNNLSYLSHKFPIFQGSSHAVGLVGLSVPLPKAMAADLEQTLIACRLKTMKQLIKQIVRDPVSSVKMSNAGLQKFIEPLIDGYKKAQHAGFHVAEISPEKLSILGNSLAENINLITKLDSDINFILSSMKQPI